MNALQVGDYVTVGAGKLAWEVLALNNGVATLRSGHFERRRSEPTRNLTLYKSGAAL